MKPMLTALLAATLIVPSAVSYAQPPETAATAATAFDKHAAQLVDLLAGRHIGRSGWR